MTINPEGNIVILASGSGSNARAIAATPHLSRRIAAVIGDRKHSRVLAWAKENGYESVHVPLHGRSRQQADRALLEAISPYNPSLIVLAGFMRILGPDFVSAYNRRIVNIHPSLLPEHPGLKAIERSWEAEDPRMGITIHLVDDGVDTGPILAQASMPRGCFADFSEAVASIHELEHALYPIVISQLFSALDCSGRKTGNAPHAEYTISHSALRNALPAHARLEVPAYEEYTSEQTQMGRHA